MPSPPRPPPDPHAVARLSAIRRAGLFLDGTVVAAGVELRVHRAVIAALSPFFAAAFAGGFSESASARLEIRDASPAAVAALVRFAYGEPALPARPDVPLALDVLALAHRLGVPALQEAAAARAAACADVGEYVTAFHALQRFGMPKAAGHLFYKMAAGYERMQKENVIWQLTATELDALVRSRDLVAEEATLLRGIAAWTRADLGKRMGQLDTILLNIRLQRPCRGRNEAARTIFGVPGHG